MDKRKRLGSPNSNKSKSSCQSPQRSTATGTAKDERLDFELMTPKETARALKSSESYLAKARMTGDGPPYVKVGRMVRYPKPKFLTWLDECLKSSTSEAKQVHQQRHPDESGEPNDGSTMNGEDFGNT